MSSRRKHVMLGMHQATEAPKDGQKIVRAVGSRGGNIVEVEYPDGRRTLCIMPSKFNKKLWVKRGGYLLIEESAEDVSSKVTGTILQVLYDEQVKQLKRLPDAWPAEFGGAADPSGSEDNSGVTGTSNHVLLPLEDGDAQLGENAENSSDAQNRETLQGQSTEPVQVDGHTSLQAADMPDSEDEDSDADLFQNNNRRVIYHDVSDDEDNEDSDSEAG